MRTLPVMLGLKQISNNPDSPGSCSIDTCSCHVHMTTVGDTHHLKGGGCKLGIDWNELAFTLARIRGHGSEVASSSGMAGDSGIRCWTWDDELREQSGRLMFPLGV